MGADDITLVSLECVLNDSAPANNSPHYFRGPETFAQVLPACSIEVVNLANTHTDDFGAEGYRSTTAVIRNDGAHGLKTPKPVVIDLVPAELHMRRSVGGDARIPQLL